MPTFIFVTEQLDQITDSIDGVATAVDELKTSFETCCDELNTSFATINTTLTAINTTLGASKDEQIEQGDTLDSLLTEITGWEVSRRRTLAFDALQGLVSARAWEMDFDSDGYDDLVEKAYNIADRSLLFDP